MIIRMGLLLAAACLLIMTAAGHFLRKTPSTAFWVLGEFATEEHGGYLLSSPTGNIQHVILDAPLFHVPQFMGWLPDGDKIMYEWRNEERGYEIRLLDLNNARHPLILTEHSFGVAETVGTLTRTADDQWVIFPLNSPQGIALFRLSHEGQVLEQISPYFISIDYANLQISPDDEWLFYQAADNTAVTPSALYRQRLDGSEFTELLRSVQRPNLLMGQDDAVFISLTQFGPQGTTDLYRVAPLNAEPERIWSGDGPYFLFTQLPSRWLLLLTLVTEPDSTQQMVYRMRPNGQDFATIIDNLAGAGFSNVGDTLYYRGSEAASPAVMATNLTTLSHYEVIPAGVFDELHWVGNSADNTHLLIKGVVGSETLIYQSNLDGTDLKPFVTFGAHDGAYIFNSSASDWNLLSINRGIPGQPKTVYMRFNVRTGEQDEPLTLPYSPQDIMLRFAPDNDTLVLSVTTGRNDSEHHWLRVSDGKVGRADYGNNITFSPVIDTTWDMTMLFGLGLASLGLSVLWSSALLVRHRLN